MFGKRFAGICVSTALVVGVGGAAAVSSSGSAAAMVGTIHRQTGVIRGSSGPEAAARLTFSCNDVTGVYKVVFTNVDVIYVGEIWPSLTVVWAIDSSIAPDHHHASDYLDLAQNTTNGLFQAKHSGVLSDVAACVSGGLLNANSFPSSSLIEFAGTLT